MIEQNKDGQMVSTAAAKSEQEMLDNLEGPDYTVALSQALETHQNSSNCDGGDKLAALNQQMFQTGLTNNGTTSALALEPAEAETPIDPETLK